MFNSYDKVSPPTSPPVSPRLSPTSSLESTNRQNRNDSRMTAASKRYKYLRRILHFRQMDFEYAFWQMIYLFISPQKVYRNFAYRKETKHQWARDDPAFLVLLTCSLLISSIGFTLALHLGFLGFIKFLLWVVFIDCIGCGLIVASIFWVITNKYMIVQPPRGQDVEWGYAFDVHLNALFPLLMILHFFQLPLLNVAILNASYLGCLCGNTIWLCAVGYYIYITFLGYSSLPFLKKTKTLLYPLTILFCIYLLSIPLKWNFTEKLCYFYKNRVM